MILPHKRIIIYERIQIVARPVQLTAQNGFFSVYIFFFCNAATASAYPRNLQPATLCAILSFVLKKNFNSSYYYTINYSINNKPISGALILYYAIFNSILSEYYVHNNIIFLPIHTDGHHGAVIES